MPIHRRIVRVEQDHLGLLLHVVGRGCALAPTRIAACVRCICAGASENFLAHGPARREAIIDRGRRRNHLLLIVAILTRVTHLGRWL